MELLSEQKLWFLLALHFYRGVLLRQHPIIISEAGKQPMTYNSVVNAPWTVVVPACQCLPSVHLIRGKGRARCTQRRGERGLRSQGAWFKSRPVPS